MQLYRFLSGANRMSHKPRPVCGQRADNQKATRQTLLLAGQRRNSKYISRNSQEKKIVAFWSAEMSTFLGWW